MKHLGVVKKIEHVCASFFQPSSRFSFCLVFDIGGLHYRHVAAKTKENLLTSFVSNHQHGRHDVMYNFTSNSSACEVL